MPCFAVARSSCYTIPSPRIVNPVTTRRAHSKKQKAINFKKMARSSEMHKKQEVVACVKRLKKIKKAGVERRNKLQRNKKTLEASKTRFEQLVPKMPQAANSEQKHLFVALLHVFPPLAKDAQKGPVFHLQQVLMHVTSKIVWKIWSNPF
jgi:maltodextrin utilization protein YvdJ